VIMVVADDAMPKSANANGKWVLKSDWRHRHTAFGLSGFVLRSKVHYGERQFCCTGQPERYEDVRHLFMDFNCRQAIVRSVDVLQPICEDALIRQNSSPY
jgi:hypothetical protein